MPRTDKLRTLRRLAERNELSKSREVADHLRSLDAEQHRLQQLRGYLNDYRRLAADRDAALPVQAMHGRRQFVARLQQGVDVQEELIDRLRGQVEVQMNRWREARSHAGALQKFHSRVEAEQASRRERAEQRGQDEIGRNQFLRKGR